MAAGVPMRLGFVQRDQICRGAIALGEVILQAYLSFEINTIEAFDALRRADGATMALLMSDNNM